VFYFCYQLWRHNGEHFSVNSVSSLRLTGLKVPDTARASYFSASSEQSTQHMLQHG
jgi:hypothetical protein